ncbi:MAG TPA: PQQ-dependent sugar dehydrogenase [Gemmatimonadaceae bacterium]|nr:PQQ-dependent sugar dehydrogenase [Gemmatimonadaceae bacterium]
MRSAKRAGIIVVLTVAIGCQDAATVAPVAPLTPKSAALQSAIEPALTIDVELIAEGLTSPIQIVSADDRTGRLFIIDQAGTIRIVTEEGVLLPTPFLDVTSRLVPLRPNFDERGLLGLAFHPKYAQNGRFFVFYSAPLRPGAPAGYDHTARISEFRVSANPDVADPLSERVILEVDKPQFNHNGGTVAFGKDRNLYISIGDGGGANDVGLGHVEDWYPDNGGGNGQDKEANLLGNILRIDIDKGTPYGIPADNPFVGKPGLDEIWATGLRNPYRISFDTRKGHRLFAGDAGQGRWEEVSLIERGGNYGWNVKEGTHCFDAENNQVEPESCPDAEPDGTPLRDPIIEYANSAQPGGIGVTVIGGNVYRGNTIKSLKGMYVFGDFSRRFFPPDGTLLAAREEASGLWPIRELRVASSANGRLNDYILGFGVDDKGEVYVGGKDVLGPSGNTGKVYRLIPAPD